MTISPHLDRVQVLSPTNRGYNVRVSADDVNGSPASGNMETTTNPDPETSFSRAIEDHLSLKKRNAALGNKMPIERYEVADPMENHPLFKSEEQARLEETIETMPSDVVPEPVVEEPDRNGANALPWPGESETEGPALDEGLWGKSRDFDWGE